MLDHSFGVGLLLRCRLDAPAAITECFQVPLVLFVSIVRCLRRKPVAGGPAEPGVFVGIGGPLSLNSREAKHTLWIACGFSRCGGGTGPTMLANLQTDSDLVLRPINTICISVKLCRVRCTGTLCLRRKE